MSRLKVLLSAYACEPHIGSEPGVGWNIARGMASYHDVWVLTRENNRRAIEAEMQKHPVKRLHFIYYDLPRWAGWWKRGNRGMQLYYYLWQLCILHTVRRAHETIRFDLAQHITFVRYWTPSFVSLLDIPFIFGPVGGGENAPPSFYKAFSFRGRLQERARDIARWVGERDPLTHLTARNTHTSLATTPETADRLKHLKMNPGTYFGAIGLSDDELQFLASFSTPVNGKLRFISIGRLLHWKGFSLGLQAFAAADLPEAEYWIVGDGPEFTRLQRMKEELGISDRVRMLGRLSRQETLDALVDSHVLVHPSLHDSGGMVCLEAMAAGKPILCLNLGGAAVHVTDETGWLVDARTPGLAIHELANTMRGISRSTDKYQTMGRNAQEHVRKYFSWARKCAQYNTLYHQITGKNTTLPSTVDENVVIETAVLH